MTWQVQQVARSNQQVFARFYDTHASKLWGIILLANLPSSQAEMMLLNTFKKAWHQVSQRTPLVEPTFAELLTIARREGLPKPWVQNSLPPKPPVPRMKDPHPHLNKPITVLIAGCTQDDQILLAQSLKASMPQTETIFAARTDQALQHLQTHSSDADKFPRLLVLTLSESDVEADWQLLQHIKASYRQLPIVVIGLTQHASLALEAYELGVNSFVVKPSDLTEWQNDLALLATYWLTIVTLPSHN